MQPDHAALPPPSGPLVGIKVGIILDKLQNRYVALSMLALNFGPDVKIHGLVKQELHAIHG